MQALIALLCSIISKHPKKREEKKRKGRYKSAREITLLENRNSIRRWKIWTSSARDNRSCASRGREGRHKRIIADTGPPNPVDALFYLLLIIYSVAINQWSATRPRRATGRPCKCRCTERIRTRVHARAHTHTAGPLLR